MTDVVVNAAETQQPSSFNPIDVLTQLLKDAGHPQPEAWKERLDSNHDKVDQNVIPPRFFVNRAVRSVLSDLDLERLPREDGKGIVTTIDERTCTVDQGSDAEWVDMMRDRVVPCMKTHNLPRSKE